jgi:hypothetical protein
MPQQIDVDDDHNALDAHGHVREALAVQVLTLDRAFKDTIAEAAPNSFRFHHDVRLALKAQAQCRASLRILLALQRDGAGKKKFAKSSERTIETGNQPA